MPPTIVNATNDSERNGQASMHDDFRFGLLSLYVFLDYLCWDTDREHAGW